MNLLYYLQGFEGAGELVRMIYGITAGTGTFMLILFETYIGISLAFFILYDAEKRSVCGGANATATAETEECSWEEPYGHGETEQGFYYTVFTGWLLALGDFDAGEVRLRIWLE